MENIIIRKYLDSDYQNLLNLITENFEINKNITITNSDTSYSIVAVLNDTIVGHIRIDKLTNCFKNCDYLIINYVCTAKEYQHQHIATTLLNYVDNIAKENNISYIELTSKPSRIFANQLYLKNGYQKKETNCFIKTLYF